MTPLRLPGGDKDSKDILTDSGDNFRVNESKRETGHKRRNERFFRDRMLRRRVSDKDPLGFTSGVETN